MMEPVSSFFVRAFLVLLASLPYGAYQLFADVLYIVTHPLTKKDRHVTVVNATRVLGYDAVKARRFCRDVLASQLFIYLEIFKYCFSNAKTHFEGEEEFVQALASFQGQGEASLTGQLVVAAHLGAWELAGHMIANHLDKRFFVLAKPSKSKWVNPLLEDLRQRLKMSVLWTGSKSLFKDMIQTLRAGDYLGFVMDQKPGHSAKGVQLKFLGIENTAFVTGPATMASRFNCGVFAVYCVRLGPGRFKIIGRTVLARGHGLTSEQEITEILAKDLEAVIREYPEQWAWNYKRWTFDYSSQF